MPRSRSRLSGSHRRDRGRAPTPASAREATQLLIVDITEWSMVPRRSWKPTRAMRGALVSRICDFCRRDRRCAPVRYAKNSSWPSLGLVPAERSTGDTIRAEGGLTLAGNRRARRALIEAAWTYRYPARVSETLRSAAGGAARSPCATSPGRPRSVCALVIVASAPQGRSCTLSSWRRSLERDGRVPVGHRTRGRASAKGDALFPAAAQSREWSTKGGELPSLIMWPGSRPTPVL